MPGQLSSRKKFTICSVLLSLLTIKRSPYDIELGVFNWNLLHQRSN